MGDNFNEEVNFEDEPLGGGDDAIPQHSIKFEGVDEAMAKAERRRERRRRRNERTGKIAACCIIVCLVIFLIIFFAVIKKGEKIYHDNFVYETKAPTPAPTHAPTVHLTPAPTEAKKPTLSVTTPSPTGTRTPPPTSPPTASPTITAAPTMSVAASYVFKPSADTYLFIDGPNTSRSYGREKVLFLQMGTKLTTKPGQQPTLPTSYGILKFDLKENRDFPARSRWTETMKVTLKLNHVPKGNEDKTSLEFNVFRIPNNYDIIVESWTGDAFKKAPNTRGLWIAKQTVEPAEDAFEIDVTAALNLSEDQLASGLYEDDQLFLRLEIGGTPDEGDEFRSRESDNPPLLVFTFAP
jgi:hypothetical protein